jgi:DNA-binding transcriptional regulator YdaS (Cro superfamily)
MVSFVALWTETTELRRLLKEVGGRNKLARLLGVSGPYLRGVLRGEREMTEEIVESVKSLPSATPVSRPIATPSRRKESWVIEAQHRDENAPPLSRRREGVA